MRPANSTEAPKTPNSNPSAIRSSGFAPNWKSERMQTTQPQTELEQAQAILELAQSALQAGCESTASQAAESERAGGQREKDLARRDAELDQRERQLEELRIRQDEVASGLERRTAELRRQLAELECQQAAFLAQCEATQQQSQAQSQTADFTAEESQAIPSASPDEPVSGRNRRRPATAHSSAPVDDSVAQDSNEQPSQEQASETQRQEQVVGEDATNEVAEPKPVARAVRTQRVADEDQSIEQYMAGLLNRMRGGSDADVVIAPERKPAKQEDPPPLVPEVKPPAAPVELEVSAQRVIDVHMAPVEMARRSTTVTEVNDLAAMRELANNHARIAIDTHSKKQLLKTALGAWTGGIGAATSSLVGFCLLPTDEVVMRAGCMAGFVVSSYWIYRAVSVTQKLLTSNPAFAIPSRAGRTQAPDDPKSS
jgi:hypothetical protein